MKQVRRSVAKRTPAVDVFVDRRPRSAELVRLTVIGDGKYRHPKLGTRRPESLNVLTVRKFDLPWVRLGDEGKIVDDDQPEVLSGLDSPSLGDDLPDACRRGIVY